MAGISVVGPADGEPALAEPAKDRRGPGPSPLTGP